MFKTQVLLVSALALFISGGLVHAEEPKNTGLIRWTWRENRSTTLPDVLAYLEKKSGQKYQSSDFLLQDERDLAFTHYQRYVQVLKGVPIDSKSVRIWTSLYNGHALQVEALLQIPSLSLFEDQAQNEALHSRINDQTSIDLVREAVLHDQVSDQPDPFIREMNWKDTWLKGNLVRIFEVKGKRGIHHLVISHAARLVMNHQYELFPQADLEAYVYPVYEEYKGNLLPRVQVQLKNILKELPKANANLYAGLKARRYFDNKISSIQATTVTGRAAGFWSMAWIKDEARKIREALPMAPNDFSNLDQGGFLLQGKYASINIHPDAFRVLTGIQFTPKASAPFFPNWIDGEPSEMVPSQAFYGKPFLSASEVLNRPVRRLPDHNPVGYLNDGFDEIQVYYAINTLMETLQRMGFRDPEISTRPFNAFLFNPDIAYKDNAFYTDDTINFTTYSKDEMNLARDNSTIWHELGHGIMDRLMGDNISLADTGGLSEGMADFVAALVIEGVTEGKSFPGSTDFRIINKTGFNLTNEVHDDGEAYGGAMKDFLDAALKRDPDHGLIKVTDLILEAMRLCRDYPGLSATDWFNHILFADEIGRRGVRRANEMKPLLMAALDGRNFHLDGTPVASFQLTNELASHQEVLAGTLASRGHAIPLKLAKDAHADLKIAVKLKSTKDYAFKYPVTVKVFFNKGPLQGAVHWMGEELGPKSLTLNTEADLAQISLSVTGTCDSVNREDGSCVDYANVQIFNRNEPDHPAAKKRFYVQVKN